MAIKLTPDHLAAIKRHGEESYPNECCGLLLGTITGGVKILQEVVAVANAREAEAQADRYLISAEDRFRAERQARRRGMGVIGCYHSHPDGQARPSEYDRAQAPFPTESFIIVAVRDGRPEGLTSWELAKDRSMFLAEEILQA